jgi:hypothetical protein
LDLNISDLALDLFDLSFFFLDEDLCSSQLLPGHRLIRDNLGRLHFGQDVLLEPLVIIVPLLDFRLDVGRCTQKYQVWDENENEVVVQLMHINDFEPDHVLVIPREVVKEVFGPLFVHYVWKLTKQEDDVDKHHNRTVDDHHKPIPHFLTQRVVFLRELHVKKDVDNDEEAPVDE